MAWAFGPLLQGAAEELSVPLGAVRFGLGNTNRYYEYANGQDFNFPNGDWCVGIWFRISAFGGHPYEYLFSIGEYDNNGFFQIGFGAPDSGDGLASKFFAVGRDSDGTLIGEDLPQGGSYAYFVSSASLAVDTPYLGIIQRRGSDCQIYLTALNTTATVDKTWDAVTNGYGARALTIPAQFGARGDYEGSRALQNDLSEAFILIGDSLTSTEITTLATGKHITAVKSTRALDLRFRALNSTEPDLSGNGRDFGVHNATGLTLVAELFPDSSDTAIAAALEAISLTTFHATVSSNRAIAALLEAISVTPSPSTVSSNRAIAGALELLTVTPAPATVSSNRIVSGALEQLTLSTFAAAISSNRSIAAGLELLSLTPFAATISASQDTVITGALEQIQLQTFAATVGTTLFASTEQISLSTFLATISSNRTITAALESISVHPNPSTISVGSNISAALEQISLTTAPATLVFNFQVAAALEQLVLRTFTADVDLSSHLSSNLVSLTLTPFGATVILDSGFVAQLESITLETFAATLTTPTHPITAPGLEYTISGQRLEYAIEDGRIDFTIPLSRIHFTFEG